MFAFRLFKKVDYYYEIHVMICSQFLTNLYGNLFEWIMCSEGLGDADDALPVVVLYRTYVNNVESVLRLDEAFCVANRLLCGIMFSV